MNRHTYLIVVIFVIYSNISAMQSDDCEHQLQDHCTPGFVASSQDTDTPESLFRRRNIFFKTVAVVTVGKNNQHAQTLLESEHPFVNQYLWPKPNYRPYQMGNGGLINPVLVAYETLREPTIGEDRVSVATTIKGHVAADGIAEYLFDKTYIGQHTPKFKYNYKLGHDVLEEAILGYLKERAIDRQRSDLTKHFFSHGAFANRFVKFIKHEWTSAEGPDDSGERTELETDLIQRHFMRSCFWLCTKLRKGEQLRQEILKGKTDPLASIQLTEFEISVESPNNPIVEECVLA